MDLHSDLSKTFHPGIYAAFPGVQPTPTDSRPLHVPFTLSRFLSTYCKYTPTHARLRECHSLGEVNVTRVESGDNPPVSPGIFKSMQTVKGCSTTSYWDVIRVKMNK
ncbi:uncharacterized protein LOC135170490 isoform X2 [Diachasmimorpha longicaudata]|uniref:uncharacterized protein LOC135170490 isoform X2 n=1 Tax=Diachasmimorpha longicaudata TaxID=58733 RepID=UPI0030B8DF48